MKHLAIIVAAAAVMLVLGTGCTGSSSKTTPTDASRDRLYPGSLPYNSPTTPPPISITP